MFTLAEIRAHEAMTAQMRLYALDVLQSAARSGMSRADMAKRYRIGGSNGDNVGYFLRHIPSLETAYRILAGELGGEVKVDC